MRRTFILCAVFLLAAVQAAQPQTVLVEAESFDWPGGWLTDQQFMDQMGSPFLLAHGIGVPVDDSRTEVQFPKTGAYRVWVRTRDWLAPWGVPGAPGKFRVLVNGEPLDTVFGTEGEEWHWQDGGTVRMTGQSVSVALHDLTGFGGRCDAIFFSADPDFRPPDGGDELALFRRKTLGLEDAPAEAGEFDLVVVGGGIAGTATAVSAARLGLKVALIQDRPVLGGNNSSEVRVHLGGNTHLPPYPALGAIVDELDSQHRGNAQPAASYDDEKKLGVVQAEKNIKLFLRTRATKVESSNNRIKAVIAVDIPTGRELRYTASLFADCTGDGTIGYLAGADYHYGRESRAETGESMAPEVADRQVMGTSVMWYAAQTPSKTTFPDIPWALPITEETAYYKTRGDWNWETGMNRDQIREAERIRDHGVRAALSNWAFLKNHSEKRADYENHRLEWVAHVAGKRESRRLMGDVLLKEQDVLQQREFPDASVTATWSIDLHYPAPENSKHFPGEEFRTVAKFTKKRPYAIPYRCLYSRNIENLFMAGRNISVTHVALGTIRVQRTTGMMGEVVGMAAALARKHNTSPRGVYENHLGELKEAMERGVGKTALTPPVVEPPDGYELAWSDSFDGTKLDRSQWNYRTDEKHWSTQLRANVDVRDGNLVITANRVDASGGRIFTGGGVISKQLFGYGYYESRFRILAGAGWHSSFWLMKHPGEGATGTDQAELELDVIENDSIDLKSYGVSTHRWKGEHASFGHKRVSTPLLSDYHVYGCEYTPTTVKYFFDGELVQTVDISSLPQGEVNIWLTSIASHLGNTPAVDTTRLPGHIYFDYVRYYRKTADR